MEVSRLSFTRKTQEDMKKDMPPQEKGKVLFARLQDLDEDGTLSKAKTRADVARLVGYPEERAQAGYMWVSSLIRRGYVSEIIREWTPSGNMVAEYHMTGSASDYGHKKTSRRKARKKVGQELRRWQDKVAAGYVPQAPEPQTFDKKQVSSDAKIAAPIKIEITRGDITIKVEMDSHEEASKLITAIMKGEQYNGQSKTN